MSLYPERTDAAFDKLRLFNWLAQKSFGSHQIYATPSSATQSRSQNKQNGIAKEVRHRSCASCRTKINTEPFIRVLLVRESA